MGAMGPSVWLAVGLLVVAQSWTSASQQSSCVPGFKTDFHIFQVERRHLHKGQVLGKVEFDGCSDRRGSSVVAHDRHFHVTADGSLKVSRAFSLHSRHRDLVVSAGGPEGRPARASVRLLVRGAHGKHHHGNRHHGKHHHGKHHHGNRHHRNHTLMADVHSLQEAQAPPAEALPVVHLAHRAAGLSRQKRAWVIPPINTLENDRGPFPKAMVQIRSDADKEVVVTYKITGPGADQPPVGLFTVDRRSGVMSVTQPLDRETQDKYLLKAHAEALGAGDAEEAMDIIVNVLDANDNKPIFSKDPFEGEVAEVSPIGFEVLTVVATDLDQPGSANSDIHYRIINQEPKLPKNHLFAINPNSGVVRVNGLGLDREKFPKYTLEVEAADMEGNGLTANAKVILKVTDSNDNAPAFEKTTYAENVPENKVGAQVVRMVVTDADDAHSPAWNAKFTIVDGDSDGRFAVETGPGKQEGIIKTAKELDFEKIRMYTLLVVVENEVPFAKPLQTSTATVVVTVDDVNEAPEFSPTVISVSRKEDTAVGSELVQLKATDPDIERKQKVLYKIVKDPARWLSVAMDTGLVKVKSTMDREGLYVKNNKYTALIAAYDNDAVPATGTGTLEISLEDVNDNAPSIIERNIKVCSKESAPQLLTVTDADGPEFAAPYTVALHGMSDRNWTAAMNDTRTGIVLALRSPLPAGDYSVVLRVADSHGLEQDNVVRAAVCDCSGPDVVCRGVRVAGVGLPVILGILGAILLLLLLVLLLLMFLRRRGGEIKQPLLAEDDVRDNIYYYDEEGGGEDDQDYYDLSVLHRGLDNRPDVFRNDEVPQFMAPAQYRPRPANPEDIGNFIVDNLKAADNDPLAPPYDSLLVFDDEGKGSAAGSLSSLNSSSSGDQDYDRLGDWGPRFKKLSDMYGGGDDDDDLL